MKHLSKVTSVFFGTLFLAIIFVPILFNGSLAGANVEEADHYSKTTETAQTSYNSATLARLSAEQVMIEAQIAYDNSYFAEANAMKTLAISKYTDLLVGGYDVCEDRMLELGDKAGVQRPACDFQ